MIVTETTLVGFTVVNGTWQLQLGLFAGSLYQWFAHTKEVWAEVDADDNKPEYIKHVLQYVIALHAFLIPITIVGQTSRLEYIGVAVFISFAGMLAAVLCLIVVADANYNTPSISNAPSLSFASFVNWLHVEIMFNMGLIVSNIAFMAVRACVKHKIYIDIAIDERKKIPYIDTLAALKDLSSAWNNEFLPFILSNALWWFDDIGLWRSKYILVIQQEFVLISNFIQAFIISVFIFVSWQSGPKWWVKVAPILYYVMLLLLYTVLPALNILFMVALFFWPDVNLDNCIYEPWLILYNVVQLGKLATYYGSVRSVYFYNAKQEWEASQIVPLNENQNNTQNNNENQDNQQEIQNAQGNQNFFLNLAQQAKEVTLQKLRQISAQNDRAGEWIPYREQTRKYGEGDIRLGQPLSLSGNCYTMSFVCQLSDEALAEIFDAESGKIYESLFVDKEDQALIDQLLQETRGNEDSQFSRNTGTIMARSTTMRYRRSTVLNTSIREVQMPVNIQDQQNQNLLEPEIQQIAYTPYQQADIYHAQEAMQNRDKIFAAQRQHIIKKTKRANVQMYATMTFFCQIFILLLITQELINEAREYINVNATITEVYCRWICATILHMATIGNMNEGLQMMKFACNHQYMFQHVFFAWVPGFMNVTVMIWVEVVNTLVIIESLTPFDTVVNFVSLTIIAEFDTYVFQSLRSERLIRLLDVDVTERVFVIQHTTSRRCSPYEMSKVKDPDGNYRPLKIRFSDRKWNNKPLYVIYKLLRMFYVSLYFYFMPFMVLFMSFLSPLILRTYHHKHDQNKQN